jgi:hypothetical protein
MSAVWLNQPHMMMPRSGLPAACRATRSRGASPTSISSQMWIPDYKSAPSTALGMRPPSMLGVRLGLGLGLGLANPNPNPAC